MDHLAWQRLYLSLTIIIQGIFFLFSGPEEDTPRPMECMEFVCRAPTELFKARREHPPFVVPRQPDLNDLATAAEQLLQNEQSSTTSVWKLQFFNSHFSCLFSKPPIVMSNPLNVAYLCYFQWCYFGNGSMQLLLYLENMWRVQNEWGMVK